MRQLSGVLIWDSSDTRTGQREAGRQVTEKGHPVKEVAERLGDFQEWRRKEGIVTLSELQVEVEAQGATFEGREGVHVDRHRVTDDLVEELFADFDFTVPQHPLVGALGVPQKLTSVGDV